LPAVKVDTEILVDAPAERVWEVLSDLGSYSDWNPMIRLASGELQTGSRIALHFAPEGQKAHDYNPKLMVVEPGRELRWLGNPRVPGFIDSQHYFILSPRGENSTHVLHGTVFYGLAVPFFRSRVETWVRKPFEDMNSALKERAEGGS
jgi:hypothetical protein